MNDDVRVALRKFIADYKADYAKQHKILGEIDLENKENKIAEAKRKELLDRLQSQEEEYQEAIKAQEIMDQIEKDRG